MKTPRDPLSDLAPEMRAMILHYALDELVAQAQKHGVILEIQVLPRKPLAMGNSYMKTSARVAREMAPRKPAFWPPPDDYVLAG